MANFVPSKNHANNTNSVSEKLACELVKNAYNQTFLSQFAALLCGVVILWGLYIPNKNNLILFSWFAFFISTVICRYILAVIFKRQTTFEQHLLLWRTLFIFCTALAGISWGIAGSILLDQASLLQQILIILIIAGISAGAIIALTAEITALILFLSATILPLILQLSIEDYLHIPKIFVIALCAFYIYIITVAIKTHNILKNNYRLRFENDELIKDIITAKEALLETNKKLEIAATHDALTGLANRSLFDLFLNAAISRTDRSNTLLALFYIDLDNFKKINDLHDHHYGDELLKAITQRMEKNVRATDLIARLGGDEFTLTMEGFKNQEAINHVATNLCKTLAMPIKIDGSECTITVSIGISIYPYDATDATSLLRHADTAMYTVKEVGGNNFHFFGNLLEKEKNFTHGNS